MKKILTVMFALMSFSSYLLAKPEVISIEMTDKKMSEVVQIINSICGSHIDLETLTNPQMNISINLDKKQCAEVVSLIQSFDKSA
ncbi:hypothetical protein CW745_14670 [Psychromonas sp. psych-6C06]|uniref:hypothetical protein n=1 Tax=Psychromonas sp. psych-6C06 TaxID=2058089 RepID=UPI000C3427D2|nr:hypothetical protein [Psychromonas sp. psych-6C06]PKF60451.1 hypothetical protein CW745_14670 [Psychromonas sp. psych-6C06]